jgi:hypothetical protein
MGTRADFYVGRGNHAEWLGSIAWDGYPDGNPAPLFGATDEADYRQRVEDIAVSCAGHWTAPEDGWPWPWEDSRTTDYAYAWDDGRVWFSAFGREWCDDPGVDVGDHPKTAVFPNMKDRMNVQIVGPKSGLIVLGIGSPKDS